MNIGDINSEYGGGTINQLKDGLMIRCLDKAEPQLRDIIIEFAIWLRERINFSIKLLVYIKNKYKSKINSNKDFIASFCQPYDKKNNPHIRIDIENHRNDVISIEEFRYSILISIAHEIVHYIQWIENRTFCEKEAEDKSVQLVNQFLDDRIYNLTITLKAKKLMELAASESSSENYEKAIELYISAIKMGCEDDILYNDIAYCYDCIKKFDEALPYYNMSLSLNSNNSTIYMNKGYALYCLDRFDEAIENYNKSLSIKPSKEAYVFMAYLEEKIGNFNKAIECYEDAIKLDVNYCIAYNEKGQLLYNMGRFEEAKKACMKAVSIDTNYADAYFNLSLIYAKLGEADISTGYLKNAVTLDKEYMNMC